MMTNVAPSGMPNGDIRAMINKKRGIFEDKSILYVPRSPERWFNLATTSVQLRLFSWQILLRCFLSLVNEPLIPSSLYTRSFGIPLLLTMRFTVIHSSMVLLPLFRYSVCSFHVSYLWMVLIANKIVNRTNIISNKDQNMNFFVSFIKQS